MSYKFWSGRQGCGMGPCALAGVYFEDRQSVLSNKKNLPEKCQGCVDETEKDRQILLEKGVACL
jgi:hypothetical protein